MLHRLCRPPSIPLSFGLATVLPRRSVSRVSWAPDPRRPRANTHRLRHGLPGYLILIPPLFGDFHFQPDSPPTCPLRPVIPKNTCPPPSYRGCWHGVSRGFFLESCHDRALDERALQAALPFFTHAILLDRAFAHCPRFPTAAPRGSPGRVSVPVWLIIRKDQLSIIGLAFISSFRMGLTYGTTDSEPFVYLSVGGQPIRIPSHGRSITKLAAGVGRELGCEYLPFSDLGQETIF
ncbi:hypothetical protein E3N88_25912 [Mikania micrantha]|uniref:Uncharacterized protein n=1 Tax=Mikania micrantha TaxID=192012 RepID=A0A5N6N7T2_9ASTR|nr:hypothetical protein E3N88_25912 [Mikania micrantha]